MLSIIPVAGAPDPVCPGSLKIALAAKAPNGPPKEPAAAVRPVFNNELNNPPPPEVAGVPACANEHRPLQKLIVRQT